MYKLLWAERVPQFIIILTLPNLSASLSFEAGHIKDIHPYKNITQESRVQAKFHH